MGEIDKMPILLPIAKLYGQILEIWTKCYLL